MGVRAAGHRYRPIGASLLLAGLLLSPGCLVPPPSNPYYSRQKNTPSLFSPKENAPGSTQYDSPLLASPSPPQAPAGWIPEAIVVWPLEAQIGVTPSLIRPLSDAARAQIHASGIFRVVSLEEMGKLAKYVDWQMSCSDLSCAIELGRQLSARMIIVGSASRIEGVNQIVLKLVDVETAEMLACAQKEGREGEVRLVETVKEAVNALLWQRLRAISPARPQPK